MLTNCRPLHITGLLEITFEASVGKIISQQTDTKIIQNKLSLVKLIFYIHSDMLKLTTSMYRMVFGR